MKYATVLLLAITFLCSGAAEAKDIKAMMEEIKKNMVIKGSESKRMSVVFNHSSHKGLNCMTCHHEVSDKSRYVSCLECHSTPGARERDPMSMFMAFHSKAAGNRSCYACHSDLCKLDPEHYGEKFKGCRPCHTSQPVKLPAE